MSDEIEEAIQTAEEEDTVVVALLVPTHIQLGAQQYTASHYEVTLSGLMEVQAILERGDLVNPENAVNEVEKVVASFFGEMNWTDPGVARDIAGLLSEKGLLRS